ncbi:MAG TPA: pilus assembly protein [archaeon]|nr:pilus assembly protein [archaeon]
MIYADTDFFLALIKENDWLKRNAARAYEYHKGNIESSDITLLELMFASTKYSLDPEVVAGSFFELTDNVKGITHEEGMKVAWLIKEKGFGPADAFHFVFSSGNILITSEHNYAEIGREIIDLKHRI